MKKNLFLFVIAICFLAAPAGAQDSTSTSFIDRSPVITLLGGISTSTSFILISDVGEMAIGKSTSTSFSTHSGFLYYPLVTTPVVAATAGNSQVALSWTAATGYLGWNVTNYSVGKATASGGPYSLSSVGNVLSSTQTNLTNGTTYYFVVRVEDAFGAAIATSTEVSAAPVAPVGPTCGNGTCESGETCSSCSADCGVCPSGGGGGGGGGGEVVVQTAAIFSGRAYPSSKVTLMKDAQLAATTVAGPDAKFEIALTGLSGGNFMFTVYSEDWQGRRSGLLTFPITLTKGATTKVSGIFISPTIDVDKSEVKRGDNISIFGQSTPSAEIIISVSSEESFVKAKSDDSGAYLYMFDTSPLALGQHSTKSKAALINEISPFGKTVGFLVGDKTVEAKKGPPCPSRADLNSDCKVNLVDFSIAAYWYKRPLSAGFRLIEKEKLNGDGKINLTDFSIMAYYWTG